jgi:hypothetical protein
VVVAALAYGIGPSYNPRIQIDQQPLRIRHNNEPLTKYGPSELQRMLASAILSLERTRLA